MALTILDGSSANIDMSIGGASYKCLFNYVTADLNRQFIDQTTFCQNGWISETPGMKQLTGSMTGFLGKGTAVCNPHLYFDDQDGVAMVLTFDTSCTMTFAAHLGRSHAALRAASTSEFALDFRSIGVVTTAWVVA